MSNWIYNPARSVFRQRNDLTAFAAAAGYPEYYKAMGEKRPLPCLSMGPAIKQTLNYYMAKKNYPKNSVEAYEKSITDELVAKCEREILNVQRIAGNVNNSMKARWRTYSGGKGSRKGRGKGSRSRRYTRRR
jgi:hypothetical protein